MIVVAQFGCTTRTSTLPGEIFDAGSIYETDDHAFSHTFEIRNTTDRVVKLLSESHTCTCTKVDFAPRTLLPGETTRLKLAINLPYSYAKQTISSVVKTDHPGLPEWQYSLSYEFFPRARVLTDVVDLGRFAPTGGAQATARSSQLVVEAFADPGRPEPIAPGPLIVPEGLVATIDGRPEITELVGGKRRLRWTIDVAADLRAAGAGGCSGILRIPFAGLREVTARVIWSVDAAITCAPAQVHFGLVGSERKTKRVVLRSRDDKPFRLTVPASRADKSSPEVIEIPPTDGSSSGASATTHIVELALAGPFDASRQTLSGSIILETDSIDAPKLLIPWSAFLVPCVGAGLPPAFPASQQEIPR